MTKTSFRLVLAFLCLFAPALAQYQYSFANMLFTKVPSTGPFDLTDCFPIISTPSNTLDSEMTKNFTVEPQMNDHCLTGDVPVYVIYYGNGFTSKQQNLINDFVANIGATDYWSVVQKAKSSTGKSAGKPFLKGIYTAPCHNKGFPCQIQHTQFKSFVEHFLNANSAVKNNQSLYLFLGGNDVDYVFDHHENALMGDCSVCGIHDAVVSGDAILPYIFVPLLKSESQVCNLGKYLPASRFPNNDYALDNLIPVVLHEMVEAITSPIPLENEHADSCNGIYFNIAQDNANIVVKDHRYTVLPVWDAEKKVCSIGDQVVNLSPC